MWQEEENLDKPAVRDMHRLTRNGARDSERPPLSSLASYRPPGVGAPRSTCRQVLFDIEIKILYCATVHKRPLFSICNLLDVFSNVIKRFVDFHSRLFESSHQCGCERTVFGIAAVRCSVAVLCGVDHEFIRRRRFNARKPTML